MSNFQLSLLTPFYEPELFPCDNCIYEKCFSCDYPETENDYCVLGDKQIEMEVEIVESN